MCGIAGVRRYGENPINAEEIKVLLAELEHRGNHATGIALMVKKEIKLIKAPKPAWAFIGDKQTEEFLDAFLPDATMAILHTRFATVGNPEDNENNHPMYLGKSAVVHNGGISNHNFYFDSEKVPRSCATDSDVFRAILDKEGMNAKAIEKMNRLSGSAAIAAFSQEDPDLLLLARSGSPLIYGVADDKIWWASTTAAIQRAVRPWVFKHGLHARKSRSDIGYFCMPDNTAYILSSKGRDRKFEFKTCTSYRAPIYNMPATYGSKMEEWKRDKKARRRISAGTAPVPLLPFKSHECPKEGCKTVNSIPRDAKWDKYLCRVCDTPLRALNAAKDEEFLYHEAVE